MPSSDDRSDATSGRERVRRQGQGSAPSRRGRGGGGRAAARDAQRRRERASASGRRGEANSSDRTKRRRPRGATTTTAAVGNRASRPPESGTRGPAPKAGKRPTSGGSPRHERRRAPSPPYQRPGLLAQLLRWLRRLQRKLKRALATPQARRILTALLARRLPGPLRVLVEGLGDPDQRGFMFWWLIVTLIVTLTIALLLSVVLAPVTGLLALVGVGIWMLIRQGRQPSTQRA